MSRPISIQAFRIFMLALLSAVAPPISMYAQSASSSAAMSLTTAPTIEQTLKPDPWEIGPFLNGGVGTGDRSSYTFLSAGLHAGRLVGSPFAPGLLRGQFEVAGDIMPLWQGRTPKFLRANCVQLNGHLACTSLYPTGGTYNGVSITPVIFRWNFLGREHGAGSHRFLPFAQGAGGLIWTNHKYPPVGPYQKAGHQGASIWNFTPQFGIGLHYFVRPKQSITFQANAVHISSASLGDTNPGVNASVQFAVGYTWWK